MNTPITAHQARGIMPEDPTDADLILMQLLSMCYRTIERRALEGRTFTWIEPNQGVLPQMIQKLQTFGYTCWTDKEGVRLFIGWGTKC